KDLAGEERSLRDIECRRAHRYRDGFVGVEGLDQAAAQIGPVVIDDRDRDLANELPEIGLRVEHAVQHRGYDQHAEDAAVGEHTAPFADEGGAYTGSGAVLR